MNFDGSSNGHSVRKGEMGRTMTTQSGEIDRSMSAVGKSTFIRTQRYDDTNQKYL